MAHGKYVLYLTSGGPLGKLDITIVVGTIKVIVSGFWVLQCHSQNVLNVFNEYKAFSD